jgi:Uma2 family endonuclease
VSLPQTLPSFTPEQYPTHERQSGVRHEYLDGFVYAMAGETPEHSTLSFNIAGLVHSQLRALSRVFAKHEGPHRSERAFRLC